jgi:hypothetical protein
LRAKAKAHARSFLIMPHWHRSVYLGFWSSSWWLVDVSDEETSLRPVKWRGLLSSLFWICEASPDSRRQAFSHDAGSKKHIFIVLASIWIIIICPWNRVLIPKYASRFSSQRLI